MKIVAQVTLLPASARDTEPLAATLRACNRAANWVSEVAYARDAKRRNELQKAVYYDATGVLRSVGLDALSGIRPRGYGQE